MNGRITALKLYRPNKVRFFVFRSLCFAAILVFFSATGVSALSLEDLIGDEHVKALLVGERPLLAQFKDPRLSLVPWNDSLRFLLRQVQNDLGPSVAVETLHLYKKPPETESPAMSTAEEARLFNEVLALSTLAGLQYFSATRGAMRTFYETSIVVDGPSTKKPVADPSFSRPPSELTVYARQKDLTFGDNVYKYDFYYQKGSIIFVQENLTALTAGIIPAVGRNKLRSVVAVLDAGEYLLVYAVSMAKAASLPGMNERVGNSFANRVEAIVHWFTNQADKAFGKK